MLNLTSGSPSVPLSSQNSGRTDEHGRQQRLIEELEEQQREVEAEFDLPAVDGGAERSEKRDRLNSSQGSLAIIRRHSSSRSPTINFAMDTIQAVTLEDGSRWAPVVPAGDTQISPQALDSSEKAEKVFEVDVEASAQEEGIAGTIPQMQSTAAPTGVTSRQQEPTTAVALAASSPPGGGAPRLDGLDGARWIASFHIVGIHYLNNTFDYFKSGGLWTQFFFVLGGFVLSYVEMARPPSRVVKMSQLQYLRRRLITIYPLYAFSLLLLIANVPPRSKPEWSVFPLHFFLLQGIVPIGDGVFFYNSVSWFLSALVVYWLLLRPLTAIIRKLNLAHCIFLYLLLWIPPTIAVNVLENSLGFNNDSPWMGGSRWKHYFGYSWLGYLHVFIGGIVTARIFILTLTNDVATKAAPTENFKKLEVNTTQAPYILKFGCVIGYALWGVLVYLNHVNIINLWDVDDNQWYRFWHNGAIMPIMSLILIGGAAGADPIAKLFNTTGFGLLGRISYSQYLLQIPVSIILANYVHVNLDLNCFKYRSPCSPLSKVWQAWFIVVLTIIAYLAQRFIERPYTEWQRTRQAEGTLGCDERLMARIDTCLDNLCRCRCFRRATQVP